MIKDYYQTYKATLFLLFLLSFSMSQNTKLTIELKNGNKITGELLNKTDSTYSLKTEFGQLTIPKKDISFISDRDMDRSVGNTKKKSFLNSYLKAKEKQISLNQQARWRSIYAAMTLGNTLYGAGIPYLLDLDQTADEYIGFRLLVFAASFSLSSSYTKNMDLPLGRSYLQFAGANLGFYSIMPIISMVGIDNLISLIVTCIHHRNAKNKTFLVSDNEDVSTSDLLRKVGKSIDKPAVLFRFPVVLLTLMAKVCGMGTTAQRVLGTLQVDISETCKALDWVPPFSIDYGLKKLRKKT